MLSYRTRRRLALLILLVGLPVYIVVSVTAVNWADSTFGRQPLWVEFAIYVVLGILWAMPFRFVFRGIGQADPDAPAGGTDNREGPKDKGRPEDRPR